MKTRPEILMDIINQNKKLIFDARDKIETLEQQICIAEETVKVAQANLREECK